MRQRTTNNGKQATTTDAHCYPYSRDGSTLEHRAAFRGSRTWRALGSDESPKVKQGHGVLSSLWTLSFGVRGATPLLLVATSVDPDEGCKHPQVSVVRP